MMQGTSAGHSFILVGPDGTIRWRADYGGAPDYTMFVPTERMLADLAQDLTLPKNFRKGAQTALEELRKDGVDVDVRVATAVSILDDLANDSNLPVHGRTSLWSVISRLESLP